MKKLAIILFVSIALWHCVCFVVWQWRNPKANAATCYSHYNDAMRFHKLPEFE